MKTGLADPDDLVDHPENWRRHPEIQRQAMREALQEVGWIQAVVVNVRSGRIVDGHGRVDEARRARVKAVPVTWVDLDEAEERRALATFDALGGLAEADGEALLALARAADAEGPTLAELLRQQEAYASEILQRAERDGAAPSSFAEKGDETVPADHECPRCGFRF